MNAEQLHMIVATAEREVDVNLRALEALMGFTAQVADELERSPLTRNEFRHKLLKREREFLQKIANAPTERLPPSRRAILSDPLIDLVIAPNFGRSVRQILQRNKRAAPTLVRSLSTLRKRLTAASELLSQTSKGLYALGIAPEESLEPSQVELSFSIPREAVHEGVEALGEEFIKLKQILNPFLELTTSTRPDVRVRAISSSAFCVFLELTPVAAAALAKAIETILNIQEKTLNIAKAKKDLEQTDVDASLIESLDKEIDRLTTDAINQYVENVIADKLDGRSHELRVDLAKKTAELARLMDRDYKVEVTAGELLEASFDPESPEHAEMRAALEIVTSASKRLALSSPNPDPSRSPVLTQADSSQETIAIDAPDDNAS